nr:MAG TPA: hypothetical protein [Caudoviricetes sp.]
MLEHRRACKGMMSLNAPSPRRITHFGGFYKR